MSKDSHIGRFLIESDIIEYHPSLAKDILRDVIIIRAEQVWAYDSIEYHGISYSFDEVEKGMRIPTYDIIIENDKFKGFNKNGTY